MPGRDGSARGTRRGRVTVTVLAAVALGFTVLALVLRTQPVTSMPHLVIAVGSTFVPLIALTGFLLALLSRRVLMSIVGGLLVVATVAIQLNWYYVPRRVSVGESTEVRVLASNLRFGRADPAVFVPLASGSADVVIVSELTPEAVAGFTRAGINEAFPFSHLIPFPDVGGVGLWSRYPLTSLHVQPRETVATAAARLRIPGVRMGTVVASVHVMSPIAGDQSTINEWRDGMAGAKAQLANFANAAGPGAAIIGGDFNSTPDVRQFRDLLTDGYRDAVEQTGAGFAPTFRSDTALPPLITIDHILTRNAAASTVKTVTIAGSDHRAVLATIRVPLEPAT